MIEALFGGTPNPAIASAAACIGAAQPRETLTADLTGVIPMFTTPQTIHSEVDTLPEATAPYPIVQGIELYELLAARLFDDEDGENVGAPGVAYAEQAPLQYKRAKVDFKKFEMLEARVVITAQGDEAGAGKGIEIYDQTGGAQLCEVTWDGAALQQALAGSWTSTHIPNSDSELHIRVKGSSGTESITIYAVDLEIKVSEQSIPV